MVFHNIAISLLQWENDSVEKQVPPQLRCDKTQNDIRHWHILFGETRLDGQGSQFPTYCCLRSVCWLIVERNLSSLIFLAEGCRRWRRICNVLRSSSHLCTAVVVHSRRGVIGMIDWCQMHRSALWPKNLSLDSHTLCVAPLQCRYMCWNQCFTNCWQARYDLFSTLSRPTTIR